MDTTSWPINPGDLAVILIIVLSAIIAAVRGLVREVLSILAWVGAAVVTFYAFPMARPWLREWISVEIIADIITGAVIFILALIVLSSIAHLLARGVRATRMGALDRTLGLLFGVARGALLVSLGFILLVWLYNNDRPGWMQEARSEPYAERGAALLLSVVPQHELSAALQSVGRTREEIEQFIEQAEPLETPEGEAGEEAAPNLPGELPDLQPDVAPTVPGGEDDRTEAPNGESGYSDASRGELDRLSGANQ